MAKLVSVPAYVYYPYAWAIGLKRALGLSCERHRSFFLLKLIRALQDGRITGRLDITAAGKRDGAGAQAIARISARCFAKAYGLRYVHTPFKTLAHAELPMEEWLSAWEELFGLGQGFESADDSDLPVVDLETYAMTPTLWRQDRLLAVRHYHTFREMVPETCVPVAAELRASYATRYPRAVRPPDAPVIVRVHVRRGDVKPGDSQTGHRFTSNNEIFSVVEGVIRAVRATGRECELYLYSLGDPADFIEFSRLPGLELRLGLPALQTFRELTDADVLVAARSDFSHVAAMYGDAITLCDPRHRVPMPDWLVIDPKTGRFDEVALSERLRRRRASAG